MKNRFRLLSALLIAVMALSLSSAVFAAPGDAGGIRVYIPNKLERLHVPDMPEYIALYTRTESVATYGNPDDPNDPCPIVAVSEPDIELFFSEQPDWAAVIWSEGTESISVNEYGYAKVSSAGHKYQPGVTGETIQIKDETTGELKRVWATTTADHKAGEDAPTEDGAFLAGKDGVTTLYNRDGSPVWVEFTVNEDFYKTGLYGAVTTVRYECVFIDGDYYIYDKDAEGNYIWEPSGKQAPVYKDEDGNEVSYGEMKIDETRKYHYDRNENGQIIYKDVLQKKMINLKGNVLYIEMPDGSHVYVDISKFDEHEHYRIIDLDHTRNNKLSIVVDKDSFVHFYYTTWYVSQVVTEYPEDLNYIVRVESDWRNDSGKFLWGYKITYATSPNERYKITYSPRKSTILENHGNDAYGFDYLPYSYPTDRSTDLEAFFRDRGEDAPKDFSGLYLHRYEEDEPIYGEYTDGTINLVSGSGDYLKYWFEEGHGARVYRRLYPCTYFKSPRYK